MNLSSSHEVSHEGDNPEYQTQRKFWKYVKEVHFLIRREKVTINKKQRYCLYRQWKTFAILNMEVAGSQLPLERLVEKFRLEEQVHLRPGQRSPQRHR